MEEAGSVGVKSTNRLQMPLLGFCSPPYLPHPPAPWAGPGHAGSEGWDGLSRCAVFTAPWPGSLEHPYFAPAQPLGA